MARNPRRIDAELQALYDRVPAMADCKGLCADSCGPIECSVRERERVERASGVKLEARCLDCSMLTPMGRCSVYEHRPMICRLFGTTPALICTHGCKPERWLTDEEGYDLLMRSMLVGGVPAGVTVDALNRVIESPDLKRQLGDVALALRIAEGLR